MCLGGSESLQSDDGKKCHENRLLANWNWRKNLSNLQFAFSKCVQVNNKMQICFKKQTQYAE